MKKIIAMVLALTMLAALFAGCQSSGGKTLITFIYDSGFMWVVCVPLAFVLSRYTDMNIVPLYFLCQLPEAIKCVLGYYMVRKGSWIQTLTD